MDDGFLRYEVRLIKPDGSSKVLEKEATPHRCTLLENRLKRLKSRNGYDAQLKFRVSKVIGVPSC